MILFRFPNHKLFLNLEISLNIENVIISILWILPKSYHPFLSKVEKEFFLHFNKYSTKTIIFSKYSQNLSVNNLHSYLIQKIKKITLKSKKKSQLKSNYLDADHPKIFLIPDLSLHNAQLVNYPSNPYLADRLLTCLT